MIAPLMYILVFGFGVQDDITRTALPEFSDSGRGSFD